MWCLQYEQCAGPQKVQKFKKMLAEIYGPKIKNEHNIGFEILNFSFLAGVGLIMLKKSVIFFYFVPKNSLGFLIEKHPSF